MFIRISLCRLNMIRADRVNELYYAKRSAPTSSQFIGHYHFTDQQGRQYMIARHGQSLDRLRYKITESHTPPSCVVNTHGYVLLYVRLPSTRSIPPPRWFSHQEVGQSIILTDVLTLNEYRVTLMSTDRPDHNSATGSIYIDQDQLTPSLCNTILNR